MPGTMQWDMLVSKYEIALDLEGRVGDDLERSDVIGVGRDWRGRDIAQLGDLDPLIVNDLPVVTQNVLDRLCGVNSVVDNGLGLPRHHVVFKASPDHRHCCRGPLHCV